MRPFLPDRPKSYPSGPGPGDWLRGGDPATEARVAHTLDALAALVRFI